ncbi:MAG: hypothetical protein JW834_04930, partial [Candidatus Diapherotrites archaeon]|nr:hypothetical protein [Candidatus Diapherotrites archaeon]
MTPVVTYGMIIAIGAVVAVAFYFMFAAEPTEAYTEVMFSEMSAEDYLLSSVQLYAPEVVRNDTVYKAVAYNSGSINLNDVTALLVRGDSSFALQMVDKEGDVVSSLPKQSIAFIPVSPFPQAGDVLVVGVARLHTTKSFQSTPKHVYEFPAMESALADKDFLVVNVSDMECGVNNTFAWTIHIDPSDIVKVYLDGYAWSSGMISYFTVTDGDETVSDSVSEEVHVTYDVSDFDYSNGVLNACVYLTDGDDLMMDYLEAVVVYTGQSYVSDMTLPVASDGSPTGNVSTDSPLLGVMTDEAAECRGSFTDKDFAS